VVLSVLRQPRYAALGVLMAIVAIVCVGAGTWQIARFQQKVHENDDLRANAHAATVAPDEILPLVGRAADPSQGRVEFRTVRATGTYDTGAQSFVRSRTLGDENGYLVLTPLRTAGGVLLVVRGFAALPASGGVPSPAAPPAGEVTVVARVQAPETRHDAAARLTGHQVESINPAEQAQRLGAPVYNGYAELEPHQPGTAGLQAVGTPDLSNPAGGALEPQHFAYVIQWYLFALLALAAPFAMARAEGKQRAREFGLEAVERPEAPEDVELTDAQRRAAKLADRYGRPVS
jgi:cytochrome oxidase assembly protein ShyY1